MEIIALNKLFTTKEDRRAVYKAIVYGSNHATRNSSIYDMARGCVHDAEALQKSPIVYTGGVVEEDVAFKDLEGKNLKISFNPDYLRDALRASVTDSVIMNFTQPLRPFTVNPDKDDVAFVQLITPVRTY
mgnify:CR=1 FL=1